MIEFDPAALVLVHVLEHANEMDQVLALCKKYDVLLIEDTCEALGTSLAGGKWLGTLGAMGTFSFYYGHHISTIEGGMVVTDDEVLYQLMLSLRSHGWSRDLGEKTRSALQHRWKVDDFSNYYTFYHDGFNLRPTDLQAKLGLSQLDLLEDIRRARQGNFEKYAELLPGFWRQSSDVKILSSFAYGTFVEDRAKLAESLASNGIESRPLLCGNLGRHPFWLKRNSEFRAPVADMVHNHGIYFPNHARLDFNQIARVCEIVVSDSNPVKFD
jgi:CDP-6-deoxy-D-xylo-4-hexulose-3-dehydrase